MIISTTTTPSGPVQTLPCPSVVPQCLNTWLFVVSCADNTDHACYCPSEIFVENVFTCIYAHGETDTIVSQAVIFFQGICAPYVPANPAIATGATVTSYITVTAAPSTTLPPAVYTTVTVQATTVVPCTDSAGAVIPGSSSTVVVSTAQSTPCPRSASPPQRRHRRPRAPHVARPGRRRRLRRAHHLPARRHRHRLLHAVCLALARPSSAPPAAPPGSRSLAWWSWPSWPCCKPPETVM